MVIDLFKVILILSGMEHNVLHLPNCSLILTAIVKGHPRIRCNANTLLNETLTSYRAFSEILLIHLLRFDEIIRVQLMSILQDDNLLCFETMSGCIPLAPQCSYSMCPGASRCFLSQATTVVHTVRYARLGQICSWNCGSRPETF